MRRDRWTGVALALAALGLAGCGQDANSVAGSRSQPVASSSPTATDTPTPNGSAPTSTRPTPVTTPTPTPTPTPDPYPVALVWDGLEVRLPSAATEVVGLHQSNHEGARDLAVVDGVASTVVLPTRERASGLQSAADIVVPPDTELRAPVTGTVLRAGTYTLYCDEVDDFLVVEPDGRPGIEVKLLHIDGVQVAAGDRVVAGETLIAPRATLLPFSSQVDEFSGPGSWPHTHLEVVDTSIPNVSNDNSGSEDC